MFTYIGIIANFAHLTGHLKRFTIMYIKRYQTSTYSQPQCDNNNNNIHQLRLTKEKWLDQMTAKKVKLQKTVQKEKRIKDNRLFERSEGRFYWSVGSTVEHTGSVPGMDKFTDFWGGIWEDDEMIEVGLNIRQKVEDVREFIVSEDNIARVIKKERIGQHQGLMALRTSGGRYSKYAGGH